MSSNFDNSWSWVRKVGISISFMAYLNLGVAIDDDDQRRIKSSNSSLSKNQKTENYQPELGGQSMEKDEFFEQFEQFAFRLPTKEVTTDVEHEAVLLIDYSNHLIKRHNIQKQSSADELRVDLIASYLQDKQDMIIEKERQIIELEQALASKQQLLDRFNVGMNVKKSADNFALSLVEPMRNALAQGITSYGAIAKYFNENDIRTAQHGSKFYASTVQKIRNRQIELGLFKESDFQVSPKQKAEMNRNRATLEAKSWYDHMARALKNGNYTDLQIANYFNTLGLRTGRGKEFYPLAIRRIKDLQIRVGLFKADDFNKA